MSIQLKHTLKKAMEDQGITQAKLAKMAKVSKATLSDYIHKNKKEVDVTIVKRICEALKLDFHEALFGVQDPNSKTVISQETLKQVFKGDYRVLIEEIVKK